MREIKFRAWDNRYKKMKLWESLNEFYHKWLVGLFTDHDDTAYVMQYTGLKDKNGKEIYEGDIVQYQYLNTSEQEIRKSEVKLMPIGDVNRNIKAYYPFCYSISGSYKEKEREITECYLTPSNDCEIIGNIYENPDLLPTQPQG